MRRLLFTAFVLLSSSLQAQPSVNLVDSFSLSVGTETYTYVFTAPPQTSRVTVQIGAPDATPWQATVSVLAVSGEIESGCSSTYTNTGTAYELGCSPQWGFFGRRVGGTKPIRMADRPGGAQVTVTVTRISGDPAGSVFVDVEQQEAPDVVFRSSVAFDGETSAQETSGGGGDGTLNLTHSATGSDRAAFCSSGNNSDHESTSCTYAGNSATEQWDTNQASTYRNAGYTIAGNSNVPTGSQTVENILAGTPTAHYMAVVTMTGVDSGTPVGTAVTRTSFTTAHDVTVSSPSADDLVVDSVTLGSGDTLTVGANQTDVTTESAASAQLRGSYQDGADGGAMTWTTVSTRHSVQGAIAFLAASAGGTDNSPLMMQGAGPE